MNKKLNVGIIGCGTIGREIVKACVGHLKTRINLAALYDIDTEKVRLLEEIVGRKIGSGSLKKLFEKSRLLIEAASGSLSADILKSAIRQKKDVLIMSIGGLLGEEKLLRKAEDAGINVYLPSGALSGMDAVKSARYAKIESVTLITRKPPGGLLGAPHLEKHGIKLDGLEDTVVFDGTAEGAVKSFPKNINVSALLSLAGIGAKKTRVKIIACPKLKRNIHEVEVKGTFGVIRTVTENVPSPTNPRTSYLAALSAIATLEGIVSNVHIGT